jgi:hypothetical protein
MGNLEQKAGGSISWGLASVWRSDPHCPSPTNNLGVIRTPLASEQRTNLMLHYIPLRLSVKKLKELQREAPSFGMR